jgi:small neutral amino acid transporter SnatA (MarC family)
MAANFVAMVLARSIMRAVGGSVLQIVGWVLSALQAGLAVQIIISAVENLR